METSMWKQKEYLGKVLRRERMFGGNRVLIFIKRKIMMQTSESLTKHVQHVLVLLCEEERVRRTIEGDEKRGGRWGMERARRNDDPISINCRKPPKVEQSESRVGYGSRKGGGEKDHRETFREKKNEED